MMRNEKCLLAFGNTVIDDRAKSTDFPAKVQRVSISGFEGRTVCIITTQLIVVQISIDTSDWSWLCPTNNAQMSSHSYVVLTFIKTPNGSDLAPRP